MACAGIYQNPKYTKKQVCALLREHGINIDDVDQPSEIVDLANNIKRIANADICNSNAKMTPNLWKEKIEKRIIPTKQNRDC